MGLVTSVCQPSTLRMMIWPQGGAQNSIAAVSAGGSRVCVLILRLNSSCSRSVAFFADEHGPPAQRFYNLLCIAYGARRLTCSPI